MSKFSLLLSLCCLMTEMAISSRILVLHIMASKSHKNFAFPIVETLKERGHEITWVSPFKTKLDNITDIVIDTYSSRKIDVNPFEDREQGRGWSQFKLFLVLPEMLVTIGSMALDSEEVQRLFDQKFDIVLLSAAFNEVGLGIAHKLNAPVVQLSAASSISWATRMTGNPAMPSFVPNLMCAFTEYMSFFERVTNILVNRFLQFYRDFLYIPKIQELWLKYDPTVPDLNELELQTSLLLTNGHFSVSGPRPYMPNIIEVGGVHCKEAKPLPKELEDFVSGSGEAGFILFSFGSIVNASIMPDRYRISFINAFSKLKQRILWKWETEHMDGLPSNVKLSKWLPQQDLLGNVYWQKYNQCY